MENNTLIFLNSRLLLEQISELDPDLARELALGLEDEEALQQKHQEYEKEVRKLEKLLTKQELLQKTKYRANQAGDLMVNQQVLGLMMHNAAVGELDTVDKLYQKSLDKAYELIHFLEEKSQFLTRLGCKLDTYVHSHPASAWVVDQAKQKLVSTVGYTQNLMRETAPLIREAAYSAAMISGGLYGASLGSAAGGIGAGPGVVFGMAGGWATAKVSELGFEYAHDQANRFNAYADHIGRDDFWLIRLGWYLATQYGADSVSSSTLQRAMEFTSTIIVIL